MARAKKPPPQEKPKLPVHSFTLTPQVVAAIQRLSHDASGFLGRTVSGSAIVRALVHQVIQKGPAAEEALFLLVEKELNVDVK